MSAKTQDENGSLLSGPPPLHKRVFVNRNLRLDSIKVIGFDMDYTIARYHREPMERLAHQLTLQKLVEMGYPKEIENFAYDPQFVIRGLTVDKKLGNILKLDRHGHVAEIYHGKHKLKKPERRTAYRNERTRFQPPRYRLVDTYFALPEISIFADLVDYCEKQNSLSVDPWQIFDDTRDCIDEVHRDESLKSIIKNNLTTYIEKDPILPQTLHKFRSAGKKLFLLTNSQWNYTDPVMTHIFDGALSEYPTWQHYFDVIIVGAGKPGFWISDEPLAQIDSDGHPIARGIHRFDKGLVYQGGNVEDFENALKFGGEDILYVGDHIYGDILRSKRSAMWRTALVVEELELELKRSLERKESIDKRTALETERRLLDDLLNIQRQDLRTLEKRAAKGDSKDIIQYEQLRAERDNTKRRLKNIIRTLDRLETNLRKTFNPYWGRVFKHNQENSRFGEQVARHACIYTSRVSNFYFYSNYQYFRSPRDFMPHELP